ncbi:hypothetical protein ES703_122407 [subsurface metagenome]
MVGFDIPMPTLPELVLIYKSLLLTATIVPSSVTLLSPRVPVPVHFAIVFCVPVPFTAFALSISTHCTPPVVVF